MRKISTILFFLTLFLCTYAQRKTIHVLSIVPIEYQIYIDGELQSYKLGSFYKIVNVPKGKKTLSISTYTNSHQTATIEIANSDSKEEYYLVNKSGEKYFLQKDEKGIIKKNSSYPLLAGYIAKRITPKLDSNYKHIHSCKTTDSIINKISSNLIDIKDSKAQETYLTSSLRNKCLTTQQIKSIGVNITDEKDRLTFYQKYFITCFDRIEFKNLLSTFSKPEYSSKFDTWLKSQ